MKQLFLTSSAHIVAHDIAQKLDLSKGNKLVYIDTPSEAEEGDKQWLEDDRAALQKAGFDTTRYTITGKTKRELQKDLQDFDHIYISGGNTLHMLKQSLKTGFYNLIQDLVINQHKTYIGTSAGSIIAGEKCPDYLLEKEDTMEIENLEGFGFVNFTVMPHWGSPYFKDLYLKGRINISYRSDNVPFIVLNDHQYVHVQNNNFKIISLLD